MENLRQELAVAVAQSIPYPLFILDDQGNYVGVVGGGDRSLYDSSRFLIGRSLFDVLPRKRATAFLETVHSALDTGTLQVVEYELASSECAGSPQDGPSGSQWFEGRVVPLELESPSRFLPGRQLVLWAAFNITRRKRAEQERQRPAEREREIVQICVFCKNIRNAEEKWEHLEAYLEKCTHLTFSHGMCPECAKRRYFHRLCPNEEND